MTDFDKYRERGAYHYDWYDKNTFTYCTTVNLCVDFCNGTTLDVGCGEGLIVDLLQQKGLEVTGIDFEQVAVDLALPELDIRQADIYEAMTEKWEYMVCHNVIEHLTKPERIREIFDQNITKAAIIITDIPQLELSKYHIKEFTPKELKDIFSGWRVEPISINKDFHGIKVYK